MDRPDQIRRVTRRRLLASTGLGTVAVAGCVGNDDDADGSDGTDHSNDSVENGPGPSGTADSDGTDETDDSTANRHTAGARQVPFRGDSHGAVVLEVYEDLACPACAAYARNGFPTIEEQYLSDGRIRYEHRDFVVTADGPAAANAAREVFERDGNEAFWTFKETVMAQQRSVHDRGVEALGDIAAQLGFDAEAVVTAAETRTHETAIGADRERGHDLGIRGTPSFVVDGALVDAGHTAIDTVVAALDDALES